jgi:hypothetical protein
MLSFFPEESSFVVKNSRANQTLGTFELINNTNHSATWKIKTNRKDRYTFEPHFGLLKGTTNVSVTVTLSNAPTPDMFSKFDTFRVEGSKICNFVVFFF